MSRGPTLRSLRCVAALPWNPPSPRSQCGGFRAGGKRSELLENVPRDSRHFQSQAMFGKAGGLSVRNNRLRQAGKTGSTLRLAD
jgi:hypothetical protein